MFYWNHFSTLVWDLCIESDPKRCGAREYTETPIPSQPSPFAFLPLPHQNLLLHRIFQVSLFSAFLAYLFFLVPHLFTQFSSVLSLISGSLRTAWLLGEGLETVRVADFKVRDRCGDLVWTIWLPSINCLNYWISSINKTGVHLCSLGILPLGLSLVAEWRRLLSAAFFFRSWHLPKLWSSLSFSVSFTCTSLPLFLSILGERFLDLSTSNTLRTPLSWAFKLLQNAMCDCQVNFSPQHWGFFYNLGPSPVKVTFSKIANKWLGYTFHLDSLCLHWPDPQLVGHDPFPLALRATMSTDQSFFPPYSWELTLFYQNRIDKSFFWVFMIPCLCETLSF